MPPHQRILAIRLSEKLNKNPSYAEKFGVVIENKNKTQRRDINVRNNF